MSKTSKMVTTIEILRKCAAAANDAADRLMKQCGNEELQPEPEPALTLETVRAVLAEKSRAGFTAQVRSLLRKHGADRLSDLDPANYKALLTDAEGLIDAT